MLATLAHGVWDANNALGTEQHEHGVAQVSITSRAI